MPKKSSFHIGFLSHFQFLKRKRRKNSVFILINWFVINLTEFIGCFMKIVIINLVRVERWFAYASRKTKWKYDRWGNSERKAQQKKSERKSEGKASKWSRVCMFVCERENAYANEWERRERAKTLKTWESIKVNYSWIIFI